LDAAKGKGSVARRSPGSTYCVEEEGGWK